MPYSAQSRAADLGSFPAGTPYTRAYLPGDERAPDPRGALGEVERVTGHPGYHATKWLFAL
jgi:hypothetical protein